MKLQVFYVNGSGGVCCYIYAVIESVFAKIQSFTINGSNGAFDRACFYFHAVVVFF